MVMIHSWDEKKSVGVISITRITGRALRDQYSEISRERLSRRSGDWSRLPRKCGVNPAADLRFRN
jgi:hypothetical protein